MNVPLPLEGHPLAAVYILGVAFAISALVALIFWKKDWF
jgi:Mg2+ and Co2+ transporter CorA